MFSYQDLRCIRCC